VDDHVLYEMMMVTMSVAIGALLIAPYSTARGAERQTTVVGRPSDDGRDWFAGDKAVHEHVHSRWTTTQFLGIDEKFGG
jgi:hypothetical protein